MADSGQGTGGLQKVERPEGMGPGAQALAMAHAIRRRLAGMPARQRNWLVALLVFLAAAIAGMGWYAQRPDWRTLFSGLEARDAQQVSQELAAAGIPYEVTADGSGVQVPAESLDKARMEVAAKGMPQTGRLGFELFDKPNWVGSEFDEKVNYQRALEGELEHTIGTISAVRSARVHLVLPEQSLFTSERKVAKASVVLKLKRSSMDPEQAERIRSLVAGSVENLAPEQVTLMDADGRVNMKPRSTDAIQADVEKDMEAKLIAMLEPLAGRDNVRATVNVSYEQGAEERTDEVYDPTQVVALSMQKTDQTAAQSGRAQGVPGTASNSPAGAPTGAVAGSQAAASAGTPPLLQKEALPVYPQGIGAGPTLRQENGTFAVTKHTLHAEEGPGRIRRVTAAVVVNDRAVMDSAGKAAWKARNSEEMRRFEQLAQAAVGFDAKRGDQVVMENISFSSNLPEIRAAGMDKVLEAARTFSATQPGLIRSLMIGLCGVLLVLFVLRPVAQQVKATLNEPLLLSASNAAREVVEIPVSVATDEVARVESPKIRALQPPAIFEHVSEHIRREPVQSTRLLETWIASDDRSSKA